MSLVFAFVGDVRRDFVSGEGVGVGKMLSGSIKVGLIATFAGPQQIGRCASKVTHLRNGPQGLFLCKDRQRRILGLCPFIGKLCSIKSEDMSGNSRLG